MFHSVWYTKSRTHASSRRLRTRLRLEELEARTMPAVYSPSQILTAYGTNLISFNGVKGDGAGQSIAIVDAYYDPSIQSDIKSFSTQWGLPQLDGLNGHGGFTVLDQSNKTLSPPGDDWTVETALDVEWAHAVAPRANIVLVEAASDLSDATGKPADLLTAVQAAAAYKGVSTVSMSWGLNEVPGETSWDSYFNVPGVTFLAASGDSGAGTIWPAVSPNVVSVGGTTLKLTSSNKISSESGWGNGAWSFYFGGSGGGFSQYEPLPSYQSGITTSTNGFVYTSFGVRLNPDVAYDGDPNTGFYVYDGADGGWYAVGGTSAGAPQWAALIAIADQGRALKGLTPLSSSQTLTALYSHTTDFHDIKGGNTGTYDVVNSSGAVIGTIPVSAVTGYDLVTGLGSPVANLLVPALASVTTSAGPLALRTGHTISSGGGHGSASSKSFTGTGASSVLSADPFAPAQGPSASQLLLTTVLTSFQLPPIPALVVPAVVAPPLTVTPPQAPFVTAPVVVNPDDTSDADADESADSAPVAPQGAAPNMVPPAPAPQAPGPQAPAPMVPGPAILDMVFRGTDDAAEMAPAASLATAAVQPAALAGASVMVLGMAFTPSFCWYERQDPKSRRHWLR
jgi:subtilase family serine protease